jgi:hypothetical protein
MAGEEGCVGGEVQHIGIAEARSALAWWLEAGVDAIVQEEPRNWLKPIARPAVSEAPAPPPNVSRPTHDTLIELQDWLASSAHLPLASATAKRVLPQGPENAAVMLLSDAPSLEDYAAGQPIGGEAWELAKKMLAAIGVAPDQAYSASLSPINAPGARLSDRDREDYARSHAATSVSPARSGFCCSATRRRRRCSASRSPRRAAMSTGSRGFALSRPSIPGT